MNEKLRRKDHALNASIETCEFFSKVFAVLTVVSFFVGYVLCLFGDIRERKQLNNRINNK